MSQYQPNNTPPKTNRTISLVAMLLAIACIYLFVSRQNIKNEAGTALKQKQTTIDSMTGDRVYLQANFDAASARLDLLMSKNIRMKDTLDSNRIAMAKLRDQIKNILDDKKAAQEDLAKARTMLYLLVAKAQEYQLYIAELERDNATLTGENNLLTEERDYTVEQNIALKMTGSVLHASNVQLDAVRHRPGGLEKEVENARRVDELRVTFDIDENRIVESGVKEIYVRIITPSRGVLYIKANGSGNLTAADGRTVKYTTIKEVSVKRNEPVRGIVARWQQKGVYIPGRYRVELYNMGYKIGQGTVELQ